MKSNDRSTLDMHKNILARLLRGEMPPLAGEQAFIDDLKGRTELPLKGIYLLASPYKFGGKKKKGSNSGGTGKAGRRAKRPRVPKGLY